MLSKPEVQTIPTGSNLGAEERTFLAHDEFEQLRALLLEEAHVQLQELRTENLHLKNSYGELLTRYDSLQQAHQDLAREKERLSFNHEHLADEQAKLRLKIEDKELFTARVTPIIADSLERGIADSSEKMAEVVAPLMAPAIKKQIHDSKDEMVEALHPIIGQTVKRAVAEAIRKLVQQINQRLDRALNRQGSWQRFKGRLTGVPEPLAVLPQVLPFTVENLFLIARKTGLLMAHVALDTHTEADVKAQMVSSMLTAIQDFIKDALGAENASDLHEFHHGEGISYIIASPMLFLAAVTKGQVPRDFSKLLERTLHRIQNSCYHAVVNFDGDTAPMEIARPFMQKFVQSFEPAPALSAREQEQTPTLTVKILYGVVGVLVMALLAWFILKPSQPPSPAPLVIEATPSTLAPGARVFRLEARMTGEVWLRIFLSEQDSTAYQDFRFQAGETYAWRASGPIRLRLGNAGETELYLDGRNLGGLGMVRQPVTLIVAREGILKKE